MRQGYNAAVTPMPDLSSGACAGMDTEMFFEHGKSSENRKAYAVCAECPVQPECLEYAMAVDVSGVWGGTNHNTRREARKLLGIGAEPVSTEPFVYVPLDASEQASLTEAQVRELRSLRERDGLTFRELAERFPVSETGARRICDYESYKWVA